MNAMCNLASVCAFVLSAGSSTLSIYMLSLKNLQRSPAELEAVFDAESKFCDEILRHALDGYDVRVRAMGCIERLPRRFRESLQALDEDSRYSNGPEVNLLVAYDAWEELRTAYNAMAGGGELIRYLGVQRPVDLVIRTGGAALLSGFLPLQSQYAFLYSLPKLFNDLSLKDVREVVSDFSSRQRLEGR